MELTAPPSWPLTSCHGAYSPTVLAPDILPWSSQPHRPGPSWGTGALPLQRPCLSRQLQASGGLSDCRSLTCFLMTAVFPPVCAQRRAGPWEALSQVAIMKTSGREIACSSASLPGPSPEPLRAGPWGCPPHDAKQVRLTPGSPGPSQWGPCPLLVPLPG